MIVTRRRKKPFPWKRVLYPLAAAGALFAALWWQPSRSWLADGPVTTPLWNATASAWKPFAAPFAMAGAQETIASQKAQIAALSAELDDARAQIAGRDRRIAALSSRLDQAQQAPPAHVPAPAVHNEPAPGLAAGFPAQAQGSSPAFARTGQIWAAMDTQAAAQIVQRLPDSYVARVFAQMPPDAVGAILEDVPTVYAVRLTQEHPELAR